MLFQVAQDTWVWREIGKHRVRALTLKIIALSEALKFYSGKYKFFVKRWVIFLCNYHTVMISIFSVSSSGWWRSRECSEAPDFCYQWTSISCTTPGLRCASCTHGRQLGDPSASGSAGVLHAPDAAETESHHSSTETPGFGPSGNPTRERVSVCLFSHYVTLELLLLSNHTLTCILHHNMKRSPSLG